MRHLLPLILVLAAIGCGGEPKQSAPAEPAAMPVLWDNKNPPIDEPERDRAKFREDINKLKEGMTAAEVEKVLGKPDDIWTPADSEDFARDGEMWGYGSDRHLGMPTLGYVTMADGKVRYWSGAWPQSRRGDKGFDVPPAPELKRLLRFMYRCPKDHNMTDPLHHLRVANALIPLGKSRALGVIREYSRLSHDQFWTSDWQFWLLRVMFEVPAAGHMRLPRIGAYGGPAKMADSPRFPVLMEDDVPLCIFKGATLAGFPEPLGSFIDGEVEKSWVLRTKLLRPPDDPFPTYKKILASKAYTSIRSGEYEEELLKSLLLLVRTAYRASELEQEWPRVSAASFDLHHKAFLALKPRWDEKLQLYVRGDGTYTLDTYDIYPLHTHTFAGPKEIEVSISVERKPMDHVGITVDYNETKGGTIYPAVLRTVKVGTGEELASFCLSPGELRGDPETFLKEKPHKGTGYSLGTSGDFTLAKGTAIRTDLFYGGKVFRGSVMTP